MGISTIDGQTVLPAEYDYLYSTADLGGSSPILNADAIIAVRGGKTGVITIDGTSVLPFQYDGIKVDYGIPNNYYRAEYFITQAVNGDVWALGAVNRNNERVADNYIFSVKDINEHYLTSHWFDPEPPAYNGPTAEMVYSFSPINGLINGFSGIEAGDTHVEFKSKPESPLLKYNGHWDIINGELMYMASYRERGAVVVFDDFSDAKAPVLDNWQRMITFTLGQRVWIFNGANLENDAAPFLSDDNRTMVPVRVVAEAFGASVNWDNGNQTDYIAKDGKTLILTVGKELPDNMGAPVLKDDRLFVPVRYIAENFGGEVGWDQSAGVVTIQFKM